MSRFTRLKAGILALVCAFAMIAAANYPYDVDAPLSPEQAEKNRAYYAEAYKASATSAAQPDSPEDVRYIQVATEAAEVNHIKEKVGDFATQYGLRDKPVLDVGSGRGYLQDVVDNYTGLDISSNVGRFYHKKFVLGTATSMPFPDSSFDGVWSIWVLEHVPNPEQALAEIRRVAKNNGMLYLFPAWNCRTWAANGYDVRPYSDFDWKGKLIKASVPIRNWKPFQATARFTSRVPRLMASWLGPTRFHYRRLEPNYKEYWEPDSDAVNSLDPYEMLLWFRSRGDECMNCDSTLGTPWMKSSPLIIRVHK